MNRASAAFVQAWTRIGPRFLPFADAATPELPCARRRVPESHIPRVEARLEMPSAELRGDCRRSNTHAASRMEVFPCALSPTKIVTPGASASRSDSKQRKRFALRKESTCIP